VTELARFVQLAALHETTRSGGQASAIKWAAFRSAAVPESGRLCETPEAPRRKSRGRPIFPARKNPLKALENKLKNWWAAG